MQLAALTLIAWTHLGWGLFLRAARALGFGSPTAGAFEPSASAGLPTASIVVAAYAEQDVIGATVGALRAQDVDAEVIVACDGSPDATAERARGAGADVVLELARGGKHAAQTAAVGVAGGEVLAFCDANTLWEPGALRALLGAFEDPGVGYACGHVSFEAADGGSNQEGAYWRAELALRALESDWHSVTAGNGAIYALRRALWDELRTDLGHDLALPHQVVRAGRRAVDVPGARAREKMVPSLEGEWRRKRRMMARMWQIVLRDPGSGGLLDPRGLPPRYLVALVSHRWLRYASPGLHVVAFVTGARAWRRGGRVDRAAFVVQLGLLGAAAVPSSARPARLARYYVLMTASIAAGGVDRVRHGEAPAGWSPPEGTR